MTSVLQILVGISIGLIGYCVLSYNQHRNRRLKHSPCSSHFDIPGERCPICLDDMNHRDMQYLPCGHALHDECFTRTKQYTKQCPVCRADI